MGKNLNAHHTYYLIHTLRVSAVGRHLRHHGFGAFGNHHGYIAPSVAGNKGMKNWSTLRPERLPTTGNDNDRSVTRKRVRRFGV